VHRIRLHSISGAEKCSADENEAWCLAGHHHHTSTFQHLRFIAFPLAPRYASPFLPEARASNSTPYPYPHTDTHNLPGFPGVIFCLVEPNLSPAYYGREASVMAVCGSFLFIARGCSWAIPGKQIRNPPATCGGDPFLVEMMGHVASGIFSIFSHSGASGGILSVTGYIVGLLCCKGRFGQL